MNKTALGLLAAVVVIVGLGVGLLLQHQRNTDLTRRFSKLEGQLLQQPAKVAEKSALLDSANTELEALRKAGFRPRQRDQDAAVPTALSESGTPEQNANFQQALRERVARAGPHATRRARH